MFSSLPIKVVAFFSFVLSFSAAGVGMLWLDAAHKHEQDKAYVDKQIAQVRQALIAEDTKQLSGITSEIPSFFDALQENSSDNVLSVDKDGKLILVPDQQGYITKDVTNTVTKETTKEVTTSTTTTTAISINDLPSVSTGSLVYRTSSGWTTGTGLYHGGTTFGIGTTSPAGTLHIANGSDAIGFIVQGTSGQTANLTNWLDSNGSTLASMDKNGKLTLATSADDHAIELTPTGNAGYLSSSGGTIFINNTNNLGTGIGIYSNAGSDALGNMINVKVDNTAYAQAAFYMNYDGSSNAVEIVSNSTDSSSNALAVTGNNPNDSTLGIIGYETSKGTIKVSHNGTGSDSNASGVSIDLKGTGTRAQGLYIDSTASGGTLGNLLRLRNESTDKFVVNYQGNLDFEGDYTQGANGTNTTFTKYGNTVGDEFFVGTTGAFRVQRSATNSEAFRVQVNGDSQGRWLGTSDGRLKWGDGSSTQDIILQRGAANQLYLEGGIIVNNNAIDIDTVIKGDTDTNLLFVDASADAIGIGISTPLAKLDIASSAAGVSNMLRLASTATAANNSGSALIFAAKRTTSGTTNIANISGIITDITQSAYKGALLFSTSNNAAPAERMRIDNSGNIGIGVTSFGSSAAKVLAIGNGTAPTSSIADGVQLYAEDTASSSELKVRDEAGNATTLSPHNFSLLPDGKSEPLAWSYYSENNGKAINVDLAKVVRTVENLSGQQFIYMKDLSTGEMINDHSISLAATSPSSLEPATTAMLTTTSDTLMAAFNEQLQDVLRKDDLEGTLSWSDTVLSVLKTLIVKGQATFESPVTFLATTLFHDQATFEKDVEIKGKLQVTKDQAGSVEIQAGETKASFTFVSPYKNVPVITTSVDEFIKGTYRVKKSVEGFTIELSEAQPMTVAFDWHAFVSDQQFTKSESVISPTIVMPAAMPTTVVLSASASAETASSSAN